MLRLSIQMSFFLWFMILYSQSFFTDCISHTQEPGIQILNVGEELKGQVIPLKMGQVTYTITGLKESQWYEVKISYPASIPASFSLQVKSNAEDLWLSNNRRLLNTEKIIFKFSSNKLSSGHGEMYVLVTVEPAGVVAKPRVKESEFVLFNIVCDELLLGIPHTALWVGTAAILCLVLALVIPYFLPLHLLLKTRATQSSYSVEAKAS